MVPSFQKDCKIHAKEGRENVWLFVNLVFQSQLCHLLLDAAHIIFESLKDGGDHIWIMTVIYLETLLPQYTESNEVDRL